MASGHNRSSEVAECNSSLSSKIAAIVSLKERYPELPDLSDNPRPFSTKVDEMNKLFSL
jgi:hypothetical protein